MAVDLICCQLEALGRCGRKSTCHSCGLKLCERHGDHCVVQGHYRFDGAEWCEGCWKKSGPTTAGGPVKRPKVI